MKRIPSLDGLRAISILLVVLGHLAISNHAPAVFLRSYASEGVRIFFVISGFLITSILCKEEARTSTIDLKTFYLRRAYRIFPAAFVFMAIMLVFYWRDFRWYNIVTAFLYLANFDNSRPWFFGHLWSLGVEEQFYLLWPTVLKQWHRHRIAILLGVIALDPVGQAILYHFKVPSGSVGGFPGAAGSLAAGCLLAMLAPRLPKINPYLAFVMMLAVAFLPLFPLDTKGRTPFVIFILDPILHLSIAGVLLHVVQVPFIESLIFGRCRGWGKSATALSVATAVLCESLVAFYRVDISCARTGVPVLLFCRASDASQAREKSNQGREFFVRAGSCFYTPLSLL